MTPLEELAQLISQKGRRILVAHSPVDLKSLQGENSVYILQLPEDSHAAGTPVILPDGSERVISGVIDPEFVESYKQVA